MNKFIEGCLRELLLHYEEGSLNGLSDDSTPGQIVKLLEGVEDVVDGWETYAKEYDMWIINYEERIAIETTSENLLPGLWILHDMNEWHGTSYLEIARGDRGHIKVKMPDWARKKVDAM